MTYRPKGKHVTIDSDDPQAIGYCDKTGSPFLRKDLVKQMEWRGDTLVWTGFLVGKPYLDKPNEQGRTPKVIPDPVPIKDPRPPQSDFYNAPGLYVSEQQKYKECTSMHWDPRPPK